MSAVLKLGMAVPNHAQKWVRVKNKNSAQKTQKNPIFSSSSSSSSSSLSLNAIKSSTTDSIHFTSTAAIYRKLGPCWRRITPCALSAHVSRLPRSLGLSFSSSSSSASSRHHSNCDYNKISECHSLSSFSSENRGELSSSSLSSSPSSSSSSSSSSESVMGSENLKPREPNQNHNHGRRLQSSSPSSKVLTLPTILTLGRVAAVPLLIGTFYVDSWWGPTATTSIFIAAAFTDWLDGYLARRMKLGTAFGAFLDPVADKLMVAATLVLLCTKPMDFGVFGQVPWLLTVPAIAIIGREITMSAVREWAASQNTKLLEAVAVNNLGKWKTATQMIALTILLATRDHSLSGPDFLVACGVVLLYISAGLAVWSLGVYMSKIWRVLMK